MIMGYLATFGAWLAALGPLGVIALGLGVAFLTDPDGTIEALGDVAGTIVEAGGEAIGSIIGSIAETPAGQLLLAAGAAGVLIWGLGFLGGDDEDEIEEVYDDSYTDDDYIDEEGAYYDEEYYEDEYYEFDEIGYDENDSAPAAAGYDSFDQKPLESRISTDNVTDSNTSDSVNLDSVQGQRRYSNG